MSDEQYTVNIGKRAIIQSRHRTLYNGRQCRITGFERHGKSKTPYYRVDQIAGLHPASSLLCKVEDLLV